MMNSVLFSSLFCSLTIIAADAVNDTIEYISQNSQDSAEEALISEQELSDDLESPKSIRYQIQKILLLSDQYKNLSNYFLRAPIICIGTGRNQNRLDQEHICSTLLRKDDVSIDKNPYFEPDIEVSDAFSLTDALPTLNNEQYGCVFSAHAGIGALPFKKSPEIDFSLKIYRIKLIPGGLFVYNSSVQPNKDICLTEFCRIFEVNDLPDLKGKIIEVFMESGFVDVDILIKDESPIYGKTAFSIVIIARVYTQSM